MRIRVIAGEYGGRMLAAPKGSTTHPMSERARNALFNMLGDVTDKTILDAYSGSGAIGIEAISRGAKNVVAIEKDRHAQQILLQNIKALGIDDKITLAKANVGGWSDTSQDKKFAIVIADPPYNDIKIAALQKLTTHVIDGGLFVLSKPSTMTAPTFEDFTIIRENQYSEASIVVYKNRIH